jgi:WD40 repeat protein
MTFAILQKAEADRQTSVAETEKARAEELKNQAELSAEEARLARNSAEKSATVAENAKEEAIKQAEIANEQRDKATNALALAETRRIEAVSATNQAVAASEEAVLNAKEARKQSDIAQKASSDAFSLRMLSISQSMAVKSVQLQKDTAVKALVAFQAYNFDKKFGDDEINPDVYSGLYNALKFLKAPDYNRLEGHSDGIRSIVMTNNGDNMFTTGSDGKILMWEMNKAGRPFTEIYQNIFLNRALALSHDDKYLACITQFSTIQIFDINDLETPPTEYELNDEVAWSLAFTPSGTLLVSYDNGTILEWNVGDGSNTPFTDKETRFISLAVSKDGRKVAGGTEDGNIFLWDKTNPTNEKNLFQESGNTIHSLAFSPDNKSLSAGDQQGNVRIWDVNTLKLTYTLEGHSARVHELKYSPDGKMLASASFDRTVQIWRTNNFNNQPVILNDHSDWVWTLAFTPDNENIIAGCVDNLIRIYPTSTDKIAQQICSLIDRNMSTSEWERFVAEDIEYEKTCKDLPAGNE